jgi:tetratricopeptide (TPR) repeat protein
MRHWMTAARLAAAGLVVAGGAVAWFLMQGRPRADAQELAAHARRAIAARRWSEAERWIDQLAKLDLPPSAEAVLRADLHSGRGQPDDALRALAGIADDDPAAAQARLMAGQIELRRDRLRAAEALFRAALRLDPTLVQAQRELIFIYGMQARRAELHAQFRALAELLPLSFDDMMLWTLSLEDIWINTGVQADLERYVAADPDDRHSRRALAEVLFRSGKLDEAEAALRPLPADDADARALRVLLALGRSRLDEAEALLAGGPADHAVLARLRGQVALRRNDATGAVAAYRVAANLEPTSQEAVQGLTLALRRLGGADAELARWQAQSDRIRRLANLLERCRTSAGRADRMLPRSLARACEDLGRIDEARGWYRVALGSDPIDPELQRALARLRGKP